jgi:hypothetical protein
MPVNMRRATTAELVAVAVSVTGLSLAGVGSTASAFAGGHREGTTSQSNAAASAGSDRDHHAN